MLKRNVKNCMNAYFPNVSVSLTEKVVTSTEKRGDSVIKRVTVQETDLKDIAEKLSVISTEDYTLENLMKAGVAMDKINLNGYMDIADKGVIVDKMENASVDAFDQLLGAEVAQKSKAKASKTTTVETNVETVNE